MKDVMIETDRFLSRSLIEDDVNNRYLSWINGENKSQYINYSSQERSIKEVRAYVSIRVNDPSVLFLGIFCRYTGEHIGNIKYEPIDFAKQMAIMGLMIGESNWRNKALAPEVIKASSMWLHNSMNIRQIHLGVDIKNKYAIRAYEKIGFKRKSSLCIEITDKNIVGMSWSLE